MLQIFNYNAGKGDCLRLRYTGASCIPHNILIDSGVIRFGLEFEAICKQIVANYEKIDVMILSHVDTDHLGGLLYNLRNKTKLNIEEVWMNHGKLMGKNTDLSVHQNDEVYTALKEQGITIKPALAGMTYDLDGATFRILWPDEETLYRLFPKAFGTVPLGKQSDYGCPVQELLDSLEPKLLAKILRTIDLLEINGPLLREPYSKPLENGIFELRTKQGSDITRVLYFFIVGKKAVLTNGFIKKSQKTPKAEKELAKKYKADYERRYGNE